MNVASICRRITNPADRVKITYLFLFTMMTLNCHSKSFTIHAGKARFEVIDKNTEKELNSYNSHYLFPRNKAVLRDSLSFKCKVTYINEVSEIVGYGIEKCNIEIFGQSISSEINDIYLYNSNDGVKIKPSTISGVLYFKNSTYNFDDVSYITASMYIKAFKSRGFSIKHLLIYHFTFNYEKNYIINSGILLGV